MLIPDSPILIIVRNLVLTKTIPTPTHAVYPGGCKEKIKMTDLSDRSTPPHNHRWLHQMLYTADIKRLAKLMHPNVFPTRIQQG